MLANSASVDLIRPEGPSSTQQKRALRPHKTPPGKTVSLSASLRGRARKREGEKGKIFKKEKALPLARIELATFALQVQRSTTKLKRQPMSLELCNILLIVSNKVNLSCFSLFTVLIIQRYIYDKCRYFPKYMEESEPGRMELRTESTIHRNQSLILHVCCGGIIALKGVRLNSIVRNIA